jgi:hypothetical protein
MKLLLLFVCLLISVNSFGQTGSTLIFTKSNDGTVKVTANNEDLKIPIVMEFDQSKFNGDSIELFSGVINLTQHPQKFGKGKDIQPCGMGNAPFCLKIQPKASDSTALELSQIEDVNCPIDGGIDVKINSKTVTTLKYTYKHKPIAKHIDHHPIQPGYVYYDAIAITSGKLSAIEINQILKGYNYVGTDSNRYLKPYYTKTEAHSLIASSLLTNLGNTDVTNVAQGLARFLAERTKEELNEAFFSQMKKQLNAYPELATAFPTTVRILNVIETYTYASVIQVLKEAFETDIQNLPVNLYDIKYLTEGDCDKLAICGDPNTNCKPYSECVSRLKELSQFFSSQEGRWTSLGLYTIKEVMQATSPDKALNSITNADDFRVLKDSSKRIHRYIDYNILSSLELSNLISQSLISRDEKQIWITSRQLDSLLTYKNGEAFKVYLGLLLSFEQRPKNDPLRKVIQFYRSDKPFDTISFGQILVNIYDSYVKYGPQIKSLVNSTYTSYNAANNAVKKMLTASENSTEVEPQVLYNYYRSFTASLKTIAHSQVLHELAGRDIGKGYDHVAQFLEPSVDLVYQISIKRYSTAVYDASIILDSLNDYKSFKPVTKSFVKYGTLISTVANAQSSEEVKQALDASVLPVGSSSIKRTSSWSISLNAFVGGYYSLQNNQEHIPVMGLSAPLGVTVSKGFSRSGNGGAVSLNIQIIDLGALVNYYLLNGDTASVPNDFKVRLSNIFSPGINLSYSIPKTPLALAIGGQYIPTLYKYEQINGVNELNPTNAWRWQISLLVDIPMYNLKVWDFRK